MVSKDIRTRIGNFLIQVREPYDLVENVEPKGQTEIHSKWLSKPLGLTDAARAEVLDTAEQCWRNEQDYLRIRDWGRAMCGLAVVMAFNDTKETCKYPAFIADVVVRISRWFWADHHWYTDMLKYAKPIVQTIWGTLPNLFVQYGHNGPVDRVVYLNGVAYKLEQIGPYNSRVLQPNGRREWLRTEWLRTDKAETVPLTADLFRHEIPLMGLFQMIQLDPNDPA
jgi:hypothetical protein